MDFPVRKGLEAPLLVHGMLSHLFNVYMLVTGFLIVLAVLFIVTSLSGKMNFILMIVLILLETVFILSMRISFMNISTRSKYRKFKKKICVISNRDLLHSL